MTVNQLAEYADEYRSMDVLTRFVNFCIGKHEYERGVTELAEAIKMFYEIPSNELDDMFGNSSLWAVLSKNDPIHIIEVVRAWQQESH